MTHTREEIEENRRVFHRACDKLIAAGYAVDPYASSHFYDMVTMEKMLDEINALKAELAAERTKRCATCRHLGLECDFTPYWPDLKCSEWESKEDS